MNTLEKGLKVAQLMQEIAKCTAELEDLLSAQQPATVELHHELKPTNGRRKYMTKARKRSLQMKRNWAKLSPYKRRKWVAKLRISVKKAAAARRAKKLAANLDNQPIV
jgi:hypothetical protein